MFPTTISAVALGLLCSLPVSRASAAPCTLCPAEATGTAAAAGLNVHVIRNINGVPTDFTVSQGTVGSCETLFLVSQATYNPDGGVDLITHVQKIAAGNTGGKGLLTLPNGTITNVTPADMATTVVGPTAPGSFRGTSYSACTTIPGATDITDSKQMQVVSYTLTPTDINVNHGANFSFVWTNATPMLPNANQQCALSNAFAGSPQSVSIAAPPTCSIAPATTNICQGGSATFTFTGTLAPGGFQSVTYCWQKGCPGAGACLSTSATLTINNAQPTNAGCYTVTATDTFGCPTNCQANLTVSPAPSCSFAFAPVCAGTTNCYTSTVLPVGGTVTHHWSITGGTGTITGTNNGPTVCVVAGTGASFTLHDDITRDGCPGSCENTVPIKPNPTCSFPVSTVCQGTLNCYTSTVLPAGGTVTHLWSVVSGTGIISGTNNGPTVCVRAGTGANFVLRDDITRDDCPGFCTNTVPIIPCVPRIAVYKQVLCLICDGTTSCPTFSTDLNTQKSATGTTAVDADGHEHCSAFCYQITVSNRSDAGIELRGLTVTDTNYPGGQLVLADHGCSFPTTLGAVGTATDHASCIVRAVTLCESTENIVTATAQGILLPSQDSVGTVSATDTNSVTIVPFDISCEKQASIDGVTWVSPLTVPPGNNTVCFRVIVHNLSDLPLTATLNDETFGCASISNVLLPPRGSATNLLCCVTNLPCPPTTNNTVMISAEVNTSATNICTCTTNNIPVRDTATCSAEVTCTVIQQVFCRVTGGGRQDLLSNPREPGVTEVCPTDAKYVTHGGQVGAPYGNGTTNCSNQQTQANQCANLNDVLLQPTAGLVENIIGNVCIHGRWTHVRHNGGVEGNFHARFFDTLDCACLAVDLNACGLYSPGISSNNVCNPGDRIAGPEPRRAPANKIVFTGVGDWAVENGRRTPRSVLFRVDIEDRSEPGGYFPGGAKPPADRYRIRIWVLNSTECMELHNAPGSGDPGLLHFRSAIAACYGIHLRDGVESQFLPNNCGNPAGRMFFGGCGEPAGRCVRLPDIDDGGELEHGNHQIHPTIKPCDPTNPQGPGLANSDSDCSGL